MTRLQSQFLVTRARLESGWKKWLLESTRVTFFTEWFESQSISDSMIRVNSSTRVIIFGHSVSNRVTLRKTGTRLDSNHVFRKMTRLDWSHNKWLETPIRVMFAKSLSSWWTNPLRLHTKNWGFLLQQWPRLAQILPVWSCSEVITGPECRSGLRKESTIFAEAGTWPGGGFWNENRTRSWSRSDNFSFYRSRIMNFIKFEFSLNGLLLD